MYRAKSKPFGKWIYGTNILVDKSYNKEVTYLASKDSSNNYQYPLNKVHTKIYKSTGCVDCKGKEIYEGDYVVGGSAWRDIDKKSEPGNPGSTPRKKLIYKVVLSPEGEAILSVVQLNYYELEGLISTMMINGNHTCEESVDGKNKVGNSGKIISLMGIGEVEIIGNELDTNDLELKELFEEHILNTTENED